MTLNEGSPLTEQSIPVMLRSARTAGRPSPVQWGSGFRVQGLGLWKSQEAYMEELRA